ncbi:MAG TPA: carboxypeptidase-like regulatory domain-containing protein, partial [Rhodothermales bacterium]
MARRIRQGWLLSLLLLGGCLADAEHSNPLDPLSDSFVDAGTVEGTVVDRLFRPVPGVEARLLTQTPDPSTIALTETDAAGAYRFEGVPSGTYSLRFTRDGYIPHIDTVSIGAGLELLNADAHVDALPVVTSASLSTVHISRWWPEDDLFLLDVQINAVDPDERPGIDSAFVVLPIAGASVHLLPGTLPGSFQQVVPADSFPAGSVHAVLGESAFVRIRDRDGHEALHPLSMPVRVIDDTPVAVSPQGLEAVADPRPLLTWARMDLPFPVKYRVDVVRDEANTDILVQEILDVPADSVSVRLPAPLSAGAYYWTVWVVDSHG